MTNANLQVMPVGSDRTGGVTASTHVNESAPGLSPLESHPAWPMIGRLPVLAAVRIPLRGFRVCDLLALRCGKTVLSSCAITEDVPLLVGKLHICWGEFEVAEQRIAIRLTRLG
jgi:hypothetical protein